MQDLKLIKVSDDTMEDKIKGGVILIGSLLWETEELNPFGENEKQLAKERNEWRRQFLDLENKVPIPMPIRYGRCSDSRACTYTMVFSRTCLSNNQGVAVAVPFKEDIDVTEYENFREMALELAKVEGINKTENNLRKMWGCISIFINPLSRHNEKIKQLWTTLKLTDRNYAEKKVSNYSFKNKLTHLTLLNTDYTLSNEINIETNLDFFFITYIQPKHRNTRINDYPSPNEIASEIINSGYGTYFYQNKKNGIITFQDIIIQRLLDELNTKTNLY